MPSLGNDQRSARRGNNVEDPKRIKLLGEILNESSSRELNDVSSQLLGPRQFAQNHARLLDLLEELRQYESKLNPELPSRTDASWKNFLTWVDSNNMTKLSDQTGVSKRQAIKQSSVLQDDEDEYSLVAKVPFMEGDKIFTIDKKLFMTTETATNDSDLNEFIRKDSIASEMQNVILVLHLLNEYSKREQSQWWPYLSILPKRILPVLRLTKQTQYILASSHIYEALKLLRSIARQYSYFYQRLSETRLPLRKDFTFEYYAWGVSCVCSRQNELPNYNAHALIPVLDMCNHNPNSSQAIFTDDSSLLFADKNLEAGDEITISYGNQSRSSGEFFIHNGFVPDPRETASKYDVVPIAIGLSKNNVLYDKKAKLMKILNMPTLGRFKLILNTHENRHKRDPHLTMFLIVFSLNEQELNFILDSANPVGVADELYEFVHHQKDEVERANSSIASCSAGNGASTCSKNDETHLKQMEAMKTRIALSVNEYLSLRASVSIALIDRTLEEAQKNEDKAIEFYAIRLLQCERRIFESYKLK